jgi:hypothetical protein
MALLSTISGTENVGLTKINAVINTVNEFGGGGLNQRLVKNSTSDFDYAFTNGELWQTSATSVNLSTLTVGGGVTLAIPFNTFNSASGLIVKVYSSGGSGNYFIAKITGTGVSYGTTNVDVQVLKIGGSGTFTDWQIVPYFSDNSEEQVNSYIAGDGTFPNTLFQSRSALTHATFFSNRNTLIRKGNFITLSGVLNVTITNTSFNPDISLGFLLNKFRIKDGNSQQIVGVATVNKAGGTPKFIGGIITNELNELSNTGLRFSMFNSSSQFAVNDFLNYNYTISWLSDYYL